MACSKDGDKENETIQVSNNNIEVYQKAFDDAVSYLEKNSSIGLNEAVDFVESIEGVTNVSVEDSLIRVTTLNSIMFTLDFNSYPEFEAENIDYEELQQKLEAIDKSFDSNIATGSEKTSDVFRDYLSSISPNNNNSNTSVVSTRGSSSNQKVKLVRRNVAIWNPWKDFSEETKQVDDVTYFINKEHPLQEFTTFTPSSFESFKNFDLIYVSSHGYKNGDIILPFDCLTKEQLNLYNNELGRVCLYWEKDRGKKQYKGLLLTEKFFEKYLPDLSNTIIYTSACYLGVKNSTFLNSCMKQNVADFFASDDICTSEDIISNFEEFYINLMFGYSTNMSFAKGKGFFIGSYIHNGKPCSYKYSRYGSKLVYYPTSHATGVGNRSSSSNAKTRSGDSNASSIIVNAQLRYATEESDDIMKSIEAGICLQDMETKKVTLIPFSNKNIISNEKRVYGDITVNNISVSLDDLIEKKQYAYCCYTKIDGEISLSNETYIFENIQDYLVFLKYSYTYITSAYYDGVLQKTDKGEKNREIRIRKKDGIYYVDYNYGPWPQSYIENLLKEKDSVYNQYYIVSNNSYKESENQKGAYIFKKVSDGKCSLNEDNMFFTGEFEWGRTGSDTSGSSYWKSKLEVKISNLDTEPTLAISESNETIWPNYGEWNKQTNSWHNYKEVTEYEFKYEGFDKVIISR